MSRRAKRELIVGLSEYEQKHSLLVGNNTVRYEKEDGSRVIRLHDTDIVTILPDGSVRLDSGGWRTPTTQERLNKHSPFGITQRKGVWYVHLPGGQVPFYDGITYDKNGVLLLPPKGREGVDDNIGEKEVKRVEKLTKLINAYCAQLRKVINAGELELPNGGDCWSCYFQASDYLSKLNDQGHISHDARRGDVFLAQFGHEDTDDESNHLILHLKEKYIMGSLVWNAIVEAGYNCPPFIMDRIVNDKESEIAVRAVRRYFKKHQHIAGN